MTPRCLLNPWRFNPVAENDPIPGDDIPETPDVNVSLVLDDPDVVKKPL